MEVSYRMRVAAIVCLSLGLMFLCSCTSKDKSREPDGYRVVSYDLATGKYIIIRTGTFENKYMRKRMTVVCSFYQRDEDQVREGPQACDLRVGQLIASNHSPNANGQYSDFVDIWEMTPEILSVQFGDGPNRTLQQFVILKNEVITD